MGPTAHPAAADETMVHDRSVAEANQLVRMQDADGVMGHSAEVDITVRATDGDVDIELPDPAKVVSYDELGF